MLSPPADSRKTVTRQKNNPKKTGEKMRVVPLVLVCFLLLAVGAAAVYFIARGMKTGKGGGGSGVAESPSAPNSIAESNYIRTGWKADAYEVLRNFLAATTAEEKLPYVIDPARTAPRMEAFYGGGIINDSDTPADGFSVYEISEEERRSGIFMLVYNQPPQLNMKEFFRPLASLEVQFGLEEADLLLSTVGNVENFATEPLRVYAAFKRTPEGLKLDWDTFAQTKYRTFQNFVELPSPGQSEVFRVLIGEDVPEKGRAVTGTRTYRLADPANSGDTTRVNVKVDSEIGRALSVINWRGSAEGQPITRTATVELRWKDDSPEPELEMSQFICWEFLGLGGEETPETASTK